MNGYREFWNYLIFGNDGTSPESLERYWYTMALVAAIFFAIGIASGRLRFLAPAATAVLVAAYVIALVPFMVWTASCSSCGASFGGDEARSGELPYIHTFWGGVFTMGVAALWTGFLLSTGIAAMIDSRKASTEPRRQT